MSNAKRPTRLRDVAEAAQVDASVVSRVLRGDPRLSIRPATRQRILATAARLNYQPNAAARALKTARATAIAILVPDLANVHYAAIAEGARERAEAADYVLLVASGSASARLQQLQGRIDGVLIALATSETPKLDQTGTGIPWLLVNRREMYGIPSVIVDDELGAQIATKHLIFLGHRRIAHVAGPQNADTARRRLQGFQAALAEHDLPIARNLVAETSFDEEGGHQAATRLLSATPRPTALFVANVRAAVGAVAAAKRLGLRIPEDVSVVGFHDAPVASYLDPPLTVVRMPLVEMGWEAADNLFKLIEGEEVDDTMVAAPPELIVRGSSAPPLE